MCVTWRKEGHSGVKKHYIIIPVAWRNAHATNTDEIAHSLKTSLNINKSHGLAANELYLLFFFKYCIYIFCIYCYFLLLLFLSYFFIICCVFIVIYIYIYIYICIYCYIFAIYIYIYIYKTMAKRRSLLKHKTSHNDIKLFTFIDCFNIKQTTVLQTVKL